MSLHPPDDHATPKFVILTKWIKKTKREMGKETKLGQISNQLVLDVLLTYRQQGNIHNIELIGDL